MPPALFFSLSIVLIVMVPYKFQDYLSQFCENVMGNSIGIMLNPQIALGSMTHFNNINSFQSKSLEYLSISLNHLQISLLLFHRFQHLSLSPPWSGLFLSGFFVWYDFKKCFYYILFLIFYCQCKKCDQFLYVNLVSCLQNWFFSSSSSYVESLGFSVYQK